MSFLFIKTKKEKAREVRKDRRRAFRQAENSIQDVKDRAKRMDKDADADWQKARDALKEGKKAAAQRALTSYRAAQVLMTKLEQKRWVFEQYLMKMEAAGTDAEFANALASVNKVTDINPEMVEDVFDTAGELLGEQQDADRFWSSLYDKEIEGATGSLQDHIPSMEELSQALEQEAAAEISGSGAKTASDMERRIGGGQEKVREMLSGK
ncbi:MAG: hypothetical protein WCJ02_11140 [bacterium]